MYSRDYKILRPGNCYHIFNRGNNKEPIFLEDQDFLNFLKRLKIALGIARMPLVKQGASLLRIGPLPEGSFTILCYCLMPNHYHFLVRQNAEIPVSKLVTKVCTSYASYFKNKYGHTGHIFQDQFKAKSVDSDTYLKYLSAYIHNNPVDPLGYDYSSFKDYVGERGGQVCDRSLLLGMFNNDPEEYRKFVLGFSQQDRESIKDLLFED